MQYGPVLVVRSGRAGDNETALRIQFLTKLFNETVLRVRGRSFARIPRLVGFNRKRSHLRHRSRDSAPRSKVALLSMIVNHFVCIRSFSSICY